MKNLKKILLLVMLVFVPLLSYTFVSADELDESEVLATSKEFEEARDKIIADDNISISDVVTDDLYFAGNSVVVNNNVYGDIIGAGNSININKDVNGSIRILANVINISDTITKNITLAGSSVNFNNINAHNIYAAAERIEFSGSANRVNLIAQTIIIDGTLNGNSTIEAEEVIIKNNANIKGKLNVKAEKEIQYIGDVNKDNIKYTHIETQKKSNEFNITSKLSSLIYHFITVSIIALILFKVGSKINDKSLQELKNKTFLHLMYGLLIFLLVPVILLFATFTIVGIPLVVISSFAYISLIMIAKAFSAIALSSLLFSKTNLNKYLALFITVLLVCISTLVPYLTTIAYLLYFSYTFGSARLLFIKEK